MQHLCVKEEICNYQMSVKNLALCMSNGMAVSNGAFQRLQPYLWT